MMGIKEFLGKRKKVIFITVIYLIALIIFNIKIEYYQNTGKMFTDEMVHVAYIAYLEETNLIIPKFEEMYGLEDPIYISKDSFKNNDYQINRFNNIEINYLGHPPLYYHIMKLCKIIDVQDEKIIFSIKDLRNVSQIISNISLIIAFIIGYKKLKTIRGNLFYALLLVSIPLITYVSGAVQNDVLSFLGVNVFILGALDLVEKKRNYKTYFLIAIGTFICLLNKITVGLVIVIAYILMIIFLAIKEKNLKFIFCKQWMATLPIYLIILAYYLIIMNNYGTIHPSLRVIAPEYYKTTVFYDGNIDKSQYPFLIYTKTFWSNFGKYWAGIESGGYLSKNNNIGIILSNLIFIFPIIYLIYKKIRKENINTANISICLAVLISIIMQYFKAYYEFLNVSGYLGGYHSRYYVCAMVPFILVFCNLIEDINKDIEKMEDRKLLYWEFNIMLLMYIAVLQGGLAI